MFVMISNDLCFQLVPAPHTLVPAPHTKSSAVSAGWVVPRSVGAGSRLSGGGAPSLPATLVRSPIGAALGSTSGGLKSLGAALRPTSGGLKSLVAALGPKSGSKTGSSSSSHPLAESLCYICSRVGDDSDCFTALVCTKCGSRGSTLTTFCCKLLLILCSVPLSNRQKAELYGEENLYLLSKVI